MLYLFLFACAIPTFPEFVVGNGILYEGGEKQQNISDTGGQESVDSGEIEPQDTGTPEDTATQEDTGLQDTSADDTSAQDTSGGDTSAQDNGS